MRRSKLYFLVTLAGATLSISTTLLAETKLTMSASTSYTNNANKAPDQLAVSERQDRTKLTLLSKSQNSSNQIRLDYSLEHEHFSKDSEEDDFTLEGASSADFFFTPKITASISHSIKQFVQDPSAPITNSNLDERSIYGASLNASTNLSPLQVVTVTPSFSHIDHENNSLDSTQAELNIAWSLKLNETNKLRAQYASRNIEYNSTTPDQHYQKATIGLNRSSRLIKYDADIGLNSFTSDNNKKTKPYLSLAIIFDDKINQWLLSANKQLTDTSFGSGNTNSSSLSLIDGIGDNVDQIQQDNIFLSYTYRAFCGTCSLMFNFEINNEEYLNTPKNDFSERIYLTGFTYKPHRPSTLKVTVSHTETEYKHNHTKDYDGIESRITYDYLLNKRLNGQIYTNYEKRNAFQPSNSYSELSAGLMLKYHF